MNKKHISPEKNITTTWPKYKKIYGGLMDEHTIIRYKNQDVL